MFIELTTVKVPINISTTLQFTGRYNFRKKKVKLYFNNFVLKFLTEYINKSTVKL